MTEQLIPAFGGAASNSSMLSFTPRRQLEERPTIRNQLLFTPRSDVKANKMAQSFQAPKSAGVQNDPRPKPVANLLSFTPRHQMETGKQTIAKQAGDQKQVVGKKSFLSFTPRHTEGERSEDPVFHPQSDSPPKAQAHAIADEDALYGGWEVTDPENPSILGRRVKNACEIKFQDDKLIIKSSTVAAAKNSVSQEDFRNYDPKVLAQTIYRFYNRCFQDVFSGVRIKTIVFRGEFFYKDLASCYLTGEN